MPTPSTGLRTAGLIFDLDGTLLDSFQAHFQAFMAMFERLGYPVTEATFFANYSPNWLETYERLGLPRELWQQADTVWMEEATSRPPQLFPGVPNLLERLATRYPLGLVTSGSKQRVLNDLERNGIRHHFTPVITGGDVRAPKPAPEGLLLALEAMRLRPDQAVYIGDALADWEMSRAAGVPFIGIPSRFASLTPETPCDQVRSLVDLLDLFP